MAVQTVPESGANENRFDVTEFQSKERRRNGAGLYLILGEMTGWAFRSSDGRVRSGTKMFLPDPLAGEGMAFMDFLEWLRTIHQVAGPLDLVACKEERRNPHGPVDGNGHGFLWHLQAWVKEHGIFLVGASPAAIRKCMSGHDWTSPPGSEQEAEAMALMRAMETHSLWGGTGTIVVRTEAGRELTHG